MLESLVVIGKAWPGFDGCRATSTKSVAVWSCPSFDRGCPDLHQIGATPRHFLPETSPDLIQPAQTWPLPLRAHDVGKMQKRATEAMLGMICFGAVGDEFGFCCVGGFPPRGIALKRQSPTHTHTTEGRSEFRA